MKWLEWLEWLKWLKSPEGDFNHFNHCQASPASTCRAGPWRSVEAPRSSMELHGAQWSSMELHGAPWSSMELRGATRSPMVEGRGAGAAGAARAGPASRRGRAGLPPRNPMVEREGNPQSQSFGAGRPRPPARAGGACLHGTPWSQAEAILRANPSPQDFGSILPTSLPISIY